MAHHVLRHKTKHKLKHKAKHKLKHRLESQKKMDKELASKHGKHHHHHKHRKINGTNGTRHDKAINKSHKVKIKEKTVHLLNTTANIKEGMLISNFFKWLYYTLLYVHTIPYTPCHTMPNQTIPYHTIPNHTKLNQK